MAYFATTEDLPFARAQWNPRNRNWNDPHPVDPPIKPPKAPRGTPPTRRRRQRGCKDGDKRVKVLVYGYERILCVGWEMGREPSAYAHLHDQLRGIKKPRRIPAAVLNDRRTTRRTARGYFKGKARGYVRENIEDN